MQQINKYYTYVLLDPRKPFKWSYEDYTFEYLPFYVGKGSGNRVKRHYFDSSVEKNPYKYNLIQELKQGGYIPTYNIIYENSTEEKAFQKEIELINFIKNNLPNSNLTNIADGGNQPPPQFSNNNVNAVKVFQYDTKTGEFLQEWSCVADACRYLNISTEMSKHITQCCRKLRRTSAGYIWRFNKEDKVEPELGKKYSRIVFTKLIAYNDSEYHEFNSMKEAYDFLKVSNKGKINQVLKGERNKYKNYFWDIEE